MTDYTDDIAARLLAMPPKPHEDMKLGKANKSPGEPMPGPSDVVEADYELRDGRAVRTSPWRIKRADADARSSAPE